MRHMIVFRLFCEVAVSGRAQIKDETVKFTRRRLLQAVSVFAFTSSPVLNPAFAQSKAVDPEALLKPGTLTDLSLGEENAPVTIVEYASLTCGHCAHFHQNTLPKLKSDYIDTGKVRYILREFPLDMVAAAASMLVRSLPQDKYYEVTDLLFKEQKAWAFTNDPYNSLLKFSKQLGFTQESFEKALTNQGMLDALNAGRERASKEFGVDSTPTLFVNGEKHAGALNIEELGKIIESKL